MQMGNNPTVDRRTVSPLSWRQIQVKTLASIASNHEKLHPGFACVQIKNLVAGKGRDLFAGRIGQMPQLKSGPPQARARAEGGSPGGAGQQTLRAWDECKCESAQCNLRPQVASANLTDRKAPRVNPGTPNRTLIQTHLTLHVQQNHCRFPMFRNRDGQLIAVPIWGQRGLCSEVDRIDFYRLHVSGVG